MQQVLDVPVANPEWATLTARTPGVALSRSTMRRARLGICSRRVAARFRVRAHLHQRVGGEAEVARAQVVQRLQKEHGAGNQRQRERDLRNDQNRREAQA